MESIVTVIYEWHALKNDSLQMKVPLKTKNQPHDMELGC